MKYCDKRLHMSYVNYIYMYIYINFVQLLSFYIICFIEFIYYIWKSALLAKFFTLSVIVNMQLYAPQSLVGTILYSHSACFEV